MENCLFCKIIRGEIPSAKVFENEHVFAFRDIAPQAPVHVLIVPKAHMDDALALEEKGEAAAEVFKAAVVIAKQEGVAADGFRIVTNCGKHGAQSVKHLHFHLLGGEQLSEKMN
ncbi:MAG: histidine triad nucleotide-binding protein [Eubacteriales bacterium]|nr:histidine triad nucleotide-binding protein [Eubacteriales bacterium]